jgi:Ni,Fe-hydrogenase maturation factor
VEILSEQPFQVGLTPEVEAAVPGAGERVMEEIANILNTSQ